MNIPRLLTPPIHSFDPARDITQMFGCSRDFYIKNFGIPGHNAVDIKDASAGNMSYGVALVAQHPVDSIRWEEDFPNKSRGSGLWLRQRLPTPIMVSGTLAVWLETVHWHVADIVIRGLPSDDTGERTERISVGEVVALMGNTGQVTPAPSRECPHCGTHVHNGIRFYDSAARIIPSDYGGYRDPIPWMHQPDWQYNVRFLRDLSLGNSGDDVAWLQTFLKIELGTTDYEPNGFFGPKTRRDVVALQERHGIPATGNVGPITRSFITKVYTIY